MEVLRWFLEGLFDLLRSYFYDSGRAFQAVSRELDWELPPALAQFFGVLVGCLLLAGGIARLFLWQPRANKSQAFPLKTAETPAEIVAKDRSALVGLLVKAAALLVIVWLLIASRS